MLPSLCPGFQCSSLWAPRGAFLPLLSLALEAVPASPKLALALQSTMLFCASVLCLGSSFCQECLPPHSDQGGLCYTSGLESVPVTHSETFGDFHWDDRPREGISEGWISKRNGAPAEGLPCLDLSLTLGQIGSLTAG